MPRRTDRTRKRELARLDRLSAAERKAELDALVADALAPSPSLSDDATPATGAKVAAAEQAPGAGRDVDVAAVVRAELARARRREVEATEQAEYDRGRCPSGACRLCGLESCLAVDAAGVESPGWHAQDGGHTCEACWQALYEGTVGVTADDRREATMRRLLGRTTIPLVAMARPDLFRDIPLWWCEHPGATPATSLDDRFAHVDLIALAAAYEAVVTHAGHGPPGEPPALPVSDPCPACGAAPASHYRLARGPVVCGGCGHHRQWIDDGGALYDALLPSATPNRPGERTPRDVDAARILGLPLDTPSYGPDPLAGLAEHVGFRYFAETGRQQPNERPWAHLDVERMRKRAARVPA